jgi:hypothetical protein
LEFFKNKNQAKLSKDLISKMSKQSVSTISTERRNGYSSIQTKEDLDQRFGVGTIRDTNQQLELHENWIMNYWDEEIKYVKSTSAYLATTSFLMRAAYERDLYFSIFDVIKTPRNIRRNKRHPS